MHFTLNGDTWPAVVRTRMLKSILEETYMTHVIRQDSRNIHDIFDCNNEWPYHFRVLIGNFPTNCANSSHLFLPIRYIMFCLATTPLTEIDLAYTSLKNRLSSAKNNVGGIGKEKQWAPYRIMWMQVSRMRQKGKKSKKPLASKINDILNQLI